MCHGGHGVGVIFCVAYVSVKGGGIVRLPSDRLYDFDVAQLELREVKEVIDICFLPGLPFLAILSPSIKNIFCSVLGVGYLILCRWLGNSDLISSLFVSVGGQ